MIVTKSSKSLKSASPYVQVLLCALVLAFVLKAFVVDAVVIPSHSMERTLLVGDFVLVNKLVHGDATRTGKQAVSLEAGFKSLPSIRRLDRGDVLVFQFPARTQNAPAPDRWFVKRCVGLPGDKIEIRDGNLSVNGELVPSAPANPSGDDEEQYVPLGEGEYFGPIVVPRAGEEIPLAQNNFPRWKKFIEREGHSCEFTPDRGIMIDGAPATRYAVEKNYLFVLGDNRDHSFDSRSWGFLPQENVIGTATCVYWSLDRTNPSGGITDFFSAIRWSRIGTLVR